MSCVRVISVEDNLFLGPSASEIIHFGLLTLDFQAAEELPLGELENQKKINFEVTNLSSEPKTLKFAKNSMRSLVAGLQ